MTLLRAECGFNSERGTLNGYLFGIARKQALRLMERGRVDVAIEGDSEEAPFPQLAVNDDPLADMTHHESIEALRRAVTALPGVIAR